MPHLVIVSPFPDLTTIPSVYGFVRHLESQQIPVTVFVPGSPSKAMGGAVPEQVKIWGQYPNWHPHGAWKLFSTESYIRFFALRQKLRRGWSAMIVLNGLGLGNAQLLNRWLGLPIWYWSLEILFDDELAGGTSSFCRWRQMEKQFLPSCSGGIIQDENKAKAFVKENPSFQNKPMLLLPNSSLGRARRQRKWLFHDLFNLPKNKKIALYSGSFSASNMVDDIALSVASWPDDWVLVIHSRHSYGDGSLLFAKKLLQKVCPPGRVFFSSAPATPEELPDILDWADVSLAFYGPDEALVLSRRNNQLMGYSSGKVNSYVQAGLPVIVNDFTRMSNWVASSGCGLVVQQPCQIGSALRGMDGHLEEYSANAIAFFNQHLCIDEQVKRVADRVLGAD
jgi:hypothetical protein